MRVSPLFRTAALALAFCLVAACGGSKDGDTTAATPPTPSARFPATVPVTAVATLDGSGSTVGSGSALTYIWTLTSRPAGSIATIAGPTAASTSVTPDVVGAYAFTLTVNDGVKTQSVPFTITAVAYTPLTILSDLVEPVSGVVQLSLSGDVGTSTVNWTVDGNALATGATVSWNTTGFADGSHAIVAQIQATSTYTLYSLRTFQVAQTPVNFTSATISETAGLFTAIVGVQSTNGIVRVDATLDGVPVGSLAARNACTDSTGAACAVAGPNGYGFGGSVASGQHVVVVTATDGIGKQLGTQLRLNVTDVP